MERNHDNNGMGLTSHNKHLLFEKFLKPGDMLKDAYQKMELLKDTLIDGQLCYRVKTKLSAGFDNVGPIDQIWHFSKKDMFPILKITATKIDGNIQYDVLRFISHEFDTVSEERFSPKQISADYTFDLR